MSRAVKLDVTVAPASVPCAVAITAATEGLTIVIVANRETWHPLALAEGLRLLGQLLVQTSIEVPDGH